jgi:HEPN domain-containing protein
MPFDPTLVAEAQGWLRKASEDLRAADFEMQAEPPLAADIVFHAQQAAEKSLKGFLTWHRQTFRKTHSIEEIGEQCLAIDASLRPIVDRAAPLTEYAWRFRYPGDSNAPPPEETHKALALAREVYEAVLSRLPPDLR